GVEHPTQRSRRRPPRLSEAAHKLTQATCSNINPESPFDAMSFLGQAFNLMKGSPELANARLRLSRTGQNVRRAGRGRVDVPELTVSTQPGDETTPLPGAMRPNHSGRRARNAPGPIH